MVAGAGPLSNIAVALVFGLLLRFSQGFGNTGFVEITTLIVFINIILAVFNLIPVPPLDGSKILFAILPARLAQLRTFFERYGFILLLFIIFFAWRMILPLVIAIFSLITGVAV